MNIEKRTGDTAISNRAYVEHVALRVRDIKWHIRFFREALGMELREVDGPLENPRQYWTLGGLQFIAAPDFVAPPCTLDGRLAHLGLMVEDLPAALRAAQQFGAYALPQDENWLHLPDGLTLELIQAVPGSVAQALAVCPRV